MTKFNKKGIIEVIDVIFMIGFMLFLILGLLYALFFVNGQEINPQIKNTLNEVKVNQVLQGILNTEIERNDLNLTVAEYIIESPIEEDDYKNTIICLFYKGLRTERYGVADDAIYYGYNLEIKKNKDDLNHRTAMKISNSPNKYLISMGKTRYIIPYPEGFIDIEFELYKPVGVATDYAPDKSNQEECKFI